MHISNKLQCCLQKCSNIPCVQKRIVFFEILCTLLTHWGRVTHICVGKLIIIGSDNGLSPGRRQAIIWTNAGILSIGPLGTNFSEILAAIITFSFKKMYLKVSSAKWRPFCSGLNVLTVRQLNGQTAPCHNTCRLKMGRDIRTISYAKASGIHYLTLHFMTTKLILMIWWFISNSVLKLISIVLLKINYFIWWFAATVCFNHVYLFFKRNILPVMISGVMIDFIYCFKLSFFLLFFRRLLV